MISDTELLECWLSRNRRLIATNDEYTALSDGLSQCSKKQVAVAFLNALESAADAGCSDTVRQLSIKVSHQVYDENISTELYLAELRSCQVSLLELLSEELVKPDSQFSILAQCNETLDQFVNECMKYYQTCRQNKPESWRERIPNKTLQHEIRTPLQSALLNCELVIEEIQSSDQSILADMHTIKQSVESAITVLNEFSRSG